MRTKQETRSPGERIHLVTIRRCPHGEPWIELSKRRSSWNRAEKPLGNSQSHCGVQQTEPWLQPQESAEAILLHIQGCAGAACWGNTEANPFCLRSGTSSGLPARDPHLGEQEPGGTHARATPPTCLTMQRRGQDGFRGIEQCYTEVVNKENISPIHRRLKETDCILT